MKTKLTGEMFPFRRKNILHEEHEITPKCE
jgi:hypothetical protein